MRSSDSTRTPSFVPSFSRYPIRVGVFEFGARQLALDESVKLLNAAETRIKFIRLREVRGYPHKTAHGITFSDGDTLLQICQSRLEELPNCQFLIGVYPFRILEGSWNSGTVTESDLENDYFALANDPRTCSVISLKDLDLFALRAARPLKVALGGLMLSEVTCLLYRYDSEIEHKASEACLLDYCDTKEEIVPSLINLDFCQKGEERIISGEFGRDLLKLARGLRSPPWHQDQPSIFWASIFFLYFGLLGLLLGSLQPGFYLSDSLKLLGQILVPIGGFFLGLSRVIKKT